MTRYESKYLRIADEILMHGDYRETRNGWVKSIFTQTLHFDMSDDRFPVLTTRKMNINSVLGEYAAIIREPNNIKDFQKWGCNYWNEFGDNNTGDLYLTTTGSVDDIHIRAVDDVQIKVQGTENAIIASGNGSVDLYYNGSKKFETMSAGATVTGTLTFANTGQVISLHDDREST